MEAKALKAEDVARLVCPVCHEGLELESGGVRCAGCGRVYPVVDEIPVLIAGRAAGA